MDVSRPEQFTANKETDFYVSKAAEDELDENPFDRGPADGPMASPDEAVVSALLGRDEYQDARPAGEKGTHAHEPEAGGGKGRASTTSASTEITGADETFHEHAITGEPQPRDQNQETSITQGPVGPTTEKEYKEFLKPSVSSEDDSEPTDQISDDTPDQQPAEAARQGPSKKRSVASPLAAQDALIPTGDVDPEARHLAKRARNAGPATLLVSPGDDTVEEEAKMRANLVRHGVFPGDDTNRRGPGPRDVRDDCDDVEAKLDDDYDLENYARFEDDDEDMSGVARDGPDIDERFMYDLAGYVPAPAEIPSGR